MSENVTDNRQCPCGHVHPNGAGAAWCPCDDCAILWTRVPRELLVPELQNRLAWLEGRVTS